MLNDTQVGMMELSAEEIDAVSGALTFWETVWEIAKCVWS